MTGKRLRSKMRMPITTNLQTVMVKTGSLKSLKGVQAPIYTKQATLKRRSMTELKTASSVCRLKKPSQAKAVPQQKAARRSSVPSIVPVPITKRARETY
jgi:hypothetical protein